ncbi:MAG: sulfatase [Bacteroidota bacterium]
MFHSIASSLLRITHITCLAGFLISCHILWGQSSPDNVNVLLIMIDDLNDCLEGWGGHTQALTPNIHRLAQSSASFRQAYTNAPMCGPSRASLFTGVYPHHSGNFFQAPWYKKETLSNTRTMMEQFKLHGYHVMGSGKILHHNQNHLWSHFEHPADYSPSPFDGEERLPHPDVPSPFYEIGWVDGSLGPFINLEGRKSPEGKALSWTTGNPNTRFTPMRYVSDDDRDPTPDERNATWAAETISDMAQNPLNQAFFLAVGFLRPHTPLVAPQKYFDLFPLDELKVAVNKPGDEEDTHLTVAYQGDVFTLRMGKKMFHDISEAYGSVELGIKKWTQAYLACVAAVDDNVGEVMKALDASPFAANTIVVLASDHGFHMGEKDYLYKNSLWEESTRIPLIMRVPGLTKAGSNIQQVVSLIDVYPTLLDLCGLPSETPKNEKGHSLDGSSLRPLLEKPQKKKHHFGTPAALTVVYGGSATKDDPRLQHYAIRSNRYRYILYSNGKEELYDHQSDPYEWTNLALKPNKKSRRQVKKMRLTLKKMLAPHVLSAWEQVQPL